MALLTLLAAVDPRPGGGTRGTALVAGLLLALVVGRAAWIGQVWSLRQSDVRSVERALARAPEGAAVLPIENRPSPRARRAAPIGRYFHFGASFFHDYTLAVSERRAFSPLVFTTLGKQPLRVQPPWDEIAVPNGGRAPTLRALRQPTAAWLKEAPYIAHWRSRFDYALMLNADLGASRQPPPPGLTLLADEGFARLYKVARTPN
jgi:hypothetical protein